MPLIDFRVATDADDADLRRILRQNPLPGKVSVTFEREPSYFAAGAIEGPFHQTLIGCVAATGEAVGMGNRAVRDLYVNGQPQPVGYMSLMRVVQHFAWGSALPRVLQQGWRAFQRLHTDGRAPYYLVSLVEGSEAAARLMLRGLPGWPVLRPVGKLHTFGLAIGRLPRRPSLARGWVLQQGKVEMLPEIVACLARNGRRNQFTPVWIGDALAEGRQTPGLCISDFWTVTQGERVVGCLARWNQCQLKQTVVRGYTSPLAHLRPIINLLAQVGLAPALPPIGSQVRHAFASHLAVDDNDPQIFAALLAAVYHSSIAAGDHFLMLGLAADHPLAAVARRYRHLLYPSTLYLATWGEEVKVLDRVDGRQLGAEVAVL